MTHGLQAPDGCRCDGIPEGRLCYADCKLAALRPLLRPSGSSSRADDPGCVWVRFSKADWAAVEAIRDA